MQVQKIHPSLKQHTQTESEGMEKIFQANGNQKRVRNS